MEGKAGRRHSFAIAKKWIDDIDLMTFDVRQLNGIGPLTEER
jgi:hypothetical protein